MNSVSEQHAAGQPRSADDDAPRTPFRRLILLLGCVALAGAAGALLRWLLGELIPEQGMKFPWVTFAINVGGSALLGLLVGIVHALPRTPGWVMPTLGTGLLGSFTTFSSVMLAAVDSMRLPTSPELNTPRELIDPALLDTTQMGIAFAPSPTVEWIAYLVISILLCSGAAAGGITVGHAIFGCDAPEDEGSKGAKR
ncbi:CrcB family protein [Nesterenkonia rhizosphaerae]|uniref:Fluoride-specific ion channel n=1 Tax=Nesterenkonia rhizosphaerae TaxID=1348272 RepID=A0ABP9FY35_9MICC